MREFESVLCFCALSTDRIFEKSLTETVDIKFETMSHKALIVSIYVSKLPSGNRRTGRSALL